MKKPALRPEELTKTKKTAFDFQRGTTFKGPPEDVVLIGLDTDDGPEHPLYKEDIHKPLEEWFVQNVDELGVIQPIAVRKNGEKAEVTWGRTRIRAAREVNLRRAKRGDPPIVVEFTLKKAELKVLHAMSAAENFARKKFSAVEEAREMAKLMRSGYDEEYVATTFACSVAKVKNRLELLSLAPELIAAVENGTAAATTVLAFKGLGHDEQKAKLVDLMQSGGLPALVHESDETAVPAALSETKNGKTNGTRRPTAQAANAAMGKRVKPNQKQMKIMIEHGSLKQATAEEYLQWLAGDRTTAKVKGLTAALRAAGLSTEIEG